ncbi:MAG: FAD-dependent oxidoreductase [Actinobacteria bacterium]|nr:FAD-dependent oxidoreductase [Actinomycetota bacterium]
MSGFDVVVVGGGLVGTACAFELAGEGARVAVCDAHHAGRATDAGAGILSPETLAWPGSPMLDLADRAGTHYRTLLAELADLGAPDPGYAVCGSVCLGVGDGDAAHYAHTRRVAFERHGDVVHDLSLEDAHRRFPLLGDVRAAFANPRAARVDGRAITAALEHGARERGVVWRVAQVAAVDVDGGRARGVRVGDEIVASDAVVIAGGAWTPELAAPLGIRAGVRPFRGQIAHVGFGAGAGTGANTGADTGAWPILQSSESYVVPWPGGRLAIGATFEDVGFDLRATVGGIATLFADGVRLAPALADATFLEVRVGLRPVSDDLLPILGAVPGVGGLYLDTGHGPEGLLLGPVSGRLVARLVCGRDPGFDLAPFSPARLA